MSEEQQSDAGPAGPFIEEELAQADIEDSDEDEVTTGGELNHTEEPAPIEPVEPEAVEVSPEEPPADPDAKTHAIFDKDYTVTPEAGYRRS